MTKFTNKTNNTHPNNMEKFGSFWFTEKEKEKEAQIENLNEVALATILKQYPDKILLWEDKKKKILTELNLEKHPIAWKYQDPQSILTNFIGIFKRANEICVIREEQHQYTKIESYEYEARMKLFENPGLIIYFLHADKIHLRFGLGGLEKGNAKCFEKKRVGVFGELLVQITDSSAFIKNFFEPKASIQLFDTDLQEDILSQIRDLINNLISNLCSREISKEANSLGSQSPKDKLIQCNNKEAFFDLLTEYNLIEQFGLIFKNIGLVADLKNITFSIQ